MDISVIGIKTLQLLVSLSLLVVLHEGGHFFFAKLFGVRVEKFYMFFDWKFRLFRFRWRGTEYGIGWIPLGGYVKISGMVDESLDKDQLKQPAKADEFRAQSVWKRFLIMVGGVLMNLITAFVIYAAVMFTWGDDVLPMRNIKQGFAFNETAESIGFRDGDIPIMTDGQEIEGYTTSLLRDLSTAKTVTVLRGGREVLIRMPEGGINMLDMLDMVPPLLTPIAPCTIDSVLPSTPAAQAGIAKGDAIVGMDGTAISYWSDFDSLMTFKQERETELVIARGSARDTLRLSLSEDMKLGVLRTSPISEEQLRHVDYNIITCMPAGLRRGWQTLTGYVSDLRYVFSAKGAKSVGSFITIGSIFPDAWDWQRFWSLTAFISIMLAVMNILPIPALDGGHVVLLLWEAVTGRTPSEKAQLWLEYIGMGLILALMILAIGNDIVRWILPQFTH